MTRRFGPYLAFDGQAREALEFYQSIFGGDLSLTTFDEYGAASERSPGRHIMHGQLETPFFFLFGADDPDGTDSGRDSGRVTMAIMGGTPDENQRVWAALAEGGTIRLPLEPQLWGDVYGELTDRFGVKWAFDYEPA